MRKDKVTKLEKAVRQQYGGSGGTLEIIVKRAGSEEIADRFFVNLGNCKKR